MHPRSTTRALLTDRRARWSRSKTRAPLSKRAPLSTRSTALHPGAWWLWALGLATAASRTTNPLLLALLIVVAGYVVAVRRTDAPWARSYAAFLKLGILVLVIRLVFAFFLGSPIPGSHVIAELPEVPLPKWAQGVRIGGGSRPRAWSSRCTTASSWPRSSSA